MEEFSTHNEIMEVLNEYSDEVRVTEVSIIKFYASVILMVRLQSDCETIIHTWECELQQAKDIAFKLI